MRVIYLSESMDFSYGGPSSTIPEMVNSLCEMGIDAEILSVRKAGSEERNDLIARYELEHSSCDISLPYKVNYSRALHRHTADFFREHQESPIIVHINNMWNWPPYYVANLCRKNQIPYVVSTRGMLLEEAQQRSRIAKKVAWWLVFKSVIEAASCIHITSSAEGDELRRMGIASPLALVPHGIAEFEAVSSDQAQRSRANLQLDSNSQYILFIARLTEHKGLHILIDAFEQLRGVLPDHKLLIAGDFASNKYKTDIMSLIAKTNLSDRIRMVGEVSGSQKLDVYRAASMFVLPTRSENFGASIGEALSFGLPIVTTKSTPWSSLEADGAGRIVHRDSAETADAILDISRWSEDQRARAHQSIKKILGDFAWSAQAAKMKSVYDWILGDACIPDCVDLPRE